MGLPKAIGANCSRCPGKNEPCFLPPSPSGKTRLAVVGGRPTEVDIKRSRAFSREKQFRHAVHTLAGVSADETHYTYATLCPVPKEAQHEAIKCCRPRLQHELENASPSVVLAVGDLGLTGFLKKPTRNIEAWRGFVMVPGDECRRDDGKYTLIATLPQALASAEPAWGAVMETDLSRVGRLLRAPFRPPEETAGRRIVIAESLPHLAAILAEMRPQVDVVVDIETAGLDIHTVGITCFVIASDQEAVVVDLGTVPVRETMQLVSDFLVDHPMVTHNGPAFDHIGLRRYGLKFNKWHDSLAALHVLQSNLPKNLGHLASLFCDIPPWKKYDRGTDRSKLLLYCGRDGLYNAIAWAGLKKQMAPEDWSVYEADQRAAIMCREMSENGFRFDVERAKDISSKLSIKMGELQERSLEIVGRRINLNSDKQLGKVFFDELRAPIYYYTDNGNPSLGVQTMTAYSSHPNSRVRELAELVLDFRSVRTTKATFVDGPLVHEDLRVRSNWKHSGTVNGRYTSNEPNLANLPNPHKDAAKEWGGVRSLYTASPGCKLVAFDVKQAEFYVAAHLSQDPHMLRICREGLDVHSANAELIFPEFPKANDATRKKLRTIAKTFLFAMFYGAGVAKVHAQLVSNGIQISVAQVEAILAKLKSVYKVYYDYQDACMVDVVRLGYMRSPILGRKRHLGHAPPPSEVANTPPQSGVADVMNIKLWNIRERMLSEGLNSKSVAMVYDANYYDVAEEDVEAMTQIIEEEFAKPIRLGELDCTFRIDLHVADRWSEL